MSRGEATRTAHGRDIVNQLAAKGIVVRGTDYKGIAEEQPAAYKDVKGGYPLDSSDHNM